MTKNVIEVKYNNDLNALPMPKLSGRQMDLFYSILAHTNENNECSLSLFNFWEPTKREVAIPVNIFVKICRANEWNRSFVKVIDEIENFLKIIIDYKVLYEDKRKKYAFVCFEKAEWDKFEQTIKVVFQKDFYNMVVNYKLGFTRFELAEFLILTSEYTKRLYIHLKQYRTQGWWLIEWEEFRHVMQIPPSYQISDIDKQILQPAIKKLTTERTLEDQKRVPFKNLKYQKLTHEQKVNQRRQTPHYIKFTFTPENKLGEQQILDKNNPNEKLLQEIDYWTKKRNNTMKTDREDKETIKYYDDKIDSLKKQLRASLNKNTTKKI